MNIINIVQFLLVVTSTVSEACRDHDGIVYQASGGSRGTSKYTCRHVFEADEIEIVHKNTSRFIRSNKGLALTAHHWSRKVCDLQMSYLKNLSHITVGPGITEDMYFKDVCPFVWKDYCTTCATNTSSTCSDHLGAIRHKKGVRLFEQDSDFVTCLEMAHDKDLNSDYCDKKVLDGFDSSEWTPGHGVTADMYIKDVCPVVFKDICTTCATGTMLHKDPNLSVLVEKVCPPNSFKKNGDCYCEHDRAILASDTNCLKISLRENAALQQAVNIYFMSALILLGLVF